MRHFTSCSVAGGKAAKLLFHHVDVPALGVEFQDAAHEGGEAVLNLDVGRLLDV
jgi:hypothetical protein